MGSVRKRPNGRWEARWYVGDRQRSRTFDTKRAAVDHVYQVEAQLRRGEWIDPREGHITLAEWVKTYQGLVVDLRPSTLARDDYELRAHVLPAFGHRRIGDITALEVQTFVADLHASGLSPVSVKHAYLMVRKILTAAVDAGLLVAAPLRGVKLPRVERQEMRHLSPGEVWRLASAIDPRHRALVLLAAYGGLRWGELNALQVERVDVLRATVRVVESVTEVRGHLVAGKPKTKAGQRTVPLPRSVAEELAHHIGQRPDPSNPVVFQAPRGGPLRRACFGVDVWAPAIQAADVAPLRFHDLRHSAVSLWIAAGADPKMIAVWAGHASVASILDRYGHLFPDRQDAVRDTLEAMFATAQEQSEGWDSSITPLTSTSRA